MLTNNETISEQSIYLVLKICNMFGIELVLNNFHILEEDIRRFEVEVLGNINSHINPKSLKELYNNLDSYKEKLCKFLEEKKDSDDNLFKEFICKILDKLYNENFRYYIYETLTPYNVYSDYFIFKSVYENFHV